MRRGRSSSTIAALLLGAAVALLVWLAGEAWRPSLPVVRGAEFPAGAQWIAVADGVQHTGCFRKDFELRGEVAHAWVMVAAEGGFEITCNGNAVGAFSYWRPTRPFQNGLTAAGQRAVASDPAMALNFPREYQWSGHANHRVPVYFDLRPYLRRGKNVVCVETEARRPQAAFRLGGEVVLADRTRVALVSNATWKAEPVPVGCGQQEWTDPRVEVERWREAVVAGAPTGRPVSFVPHGIFREPFEAPWMVAESLEVSRGGMAGQDFVFEWEQDGGVSEAWLRVAAQGLFVLSVNGTPVDPASREREELANGGWLVRWEGRRPLAVPPALLDPDEAGEYFTGNRFANPRHGDPTVNDFERYENTLNRTRERPKATAQGAGLDDRYGEKLDKGRLSDPKGFYEEADRRVPVEVTRPQNREAFVAYSVGDLLRPGANEVRVRVLAEPAAGYRRSRPFGVAVDGQVTGTGGGAYRFASGMPGWRSEWRGHGLDVTAGAVARRPGRAFPELRFIGEATAGPNWKRWGAGAGLLACLAGFGWWRGRRSAVPGAVRGGLASFAALAAGGALVRIALFERSEHLWFRGGEWAVMVLGIAAAGGVAAWWLGGRRRGGRRRMTGRAAAWVLAGLLALTFGLRAWHVADQPIDDDEYASIQAVASIAETGVPGIGEGIWYSRSPLYHYAAGAAAAVFGTNLWTLRLFSVAAAVATGWLVWTMARRYFGNRWVAGVATLLFAIHPFLIFSGHIARFYQQQQFFVLLTLHLFLLGFVDAREVKWRVGAVLAFGAAVFSQEISVALVPVLAVLYVLFGKSVPWRWEVRTVLAVAVVALVVAGDILLFQLKCLTRATGVSPNVEATIAPTFWELGNMLSMLVGYSRLHVVLSVFLPVSLWAALRGGKRNIAALHVALGAGVIVFNLLITSVSFRYQYALLPLWILLGSHGMWEAGRWAARVAGNAPAGAAVRWAVLLAVVVSWSPWRIAGSYGEKILGDSISALQHVKVNLREGDKVMVTEPHPHAAKMEIGRVDYDLVVPVLYDFTYSDDGVLRDRNGDAEVVNRLARLQEVFADDERVWVVVNREKFRSRKKNIRWDYPGAREELFLRQNCQLVFRSYLWNVYLWDRNKGTMSAFRSERGGWVE